MYLYKKVLCTVLPLMFMNPLFSHELHTSKTISPPGPVTYAPSSAANGERIEHGELITKIDAARKKLHAQHHGYTPVATLSLPTKFDKPTIKTVKDYATAFKDLVLVHPGPGEYVKVMEGQRYGYNNLSVGITNTEPGGSPPMHTHPGEESHVLLKGTIKYAVGSETFVAKAPYIMHIPPMVPHSFRNEGDSVANIIVIFPTNIWEYDVLDYFPFDKK